MKTLLESLPISPCEWSKIVDKNDELVGRVDFVPSARPLRLGPEHELVCRFLRQIAEIHEFGRSDTRVTVFIEPKLQSGFPDIVVVEWHEPTTSQWAVERLSLKVDDFRAVHALGAQKTASESDLKACFGVTKRTLERLKLAGLAEGNAEQWCLTGLQEIFAVRRIIAFEAKVADWRGAIKQAALNRWFASESYVLLGRVPSNPLFDEMIEASGVGVWIEGESQPYVRPQNWDSAQPLSYVSWLFNEWAWRHSSEVRTLHA